MISEGSGYSWPGMNRATRMGPQLHCLDWDVRDDTTLRTRVPAGEIRRPHKGFTSLNSKGTKTVLVPETAESVQYNKTPALSNRMDERECGNTENLLFPPRRELCFPLLCPSPLHRAVPNKCNQRGSLGGMSVTKSNGSLQILQEGWTSPLPARKTTEGHDGALSPHPLSVSLPPLFFFFFLQTSNFLTFLFSKSVHLRWWQCSRRHDTAVVTLWFRLHQDSQRYREATGRRRRGAKFIQNLTPHTAARDSGTVWNYFVTSQILSPPLFSPPLIFMSASPPAVLSFSVFPQCLHFEPDSINLSGKLQMFWAELCKPRRNKAAKKKHGVLALFHNSSRSQIEPRKKLDLLSSPAHSGSKSFWNMLENINHPLSTSQIKIKHTRTHAHMHRFLLWVWFHYSSNRSSGVSHISPDFTARRQSHGCYASATKRRSGETAASPAPLPPFLRLQNTNLQCWKSD